MLLAVTLSYTAAMAQDEVINGAAFYPEGPLVAGADLYYAEMGSDRVMRWDGVANAVVWSRRGCGPTSVARHPAGGLAVLCHREGALIQIAPDGATLATTGHDRGNLLFDNPNASVNDARGGLYFSSSGPFAPSARAEGAILYLAPDGSLQRVAEGIHYANGVALSADGARLYVSEHLSRHILAYEVADDGSLSGQAVFAALDDLVGVEDGRSWEVGPDGLAVDRKGNLFVAEYGAGRVLVIGPDGSLRTSLAVPERYVTGVALAPDDARLFITGPASRQPPMSGAVRVIANPLSVD